MTFKKTLLTTLCSFALMFAFVGVSQAQPLPEAPEAERETVALELLKKNPNAVLSTPRDFAASRAVSAYVRK
jgi:hypothetical protein